jgi:hypothetical protein
LLVSDCECRLRATPENQPPTAASYLGVTEGSRPWFIGLVIVIAVLAVPRIIRRKLWVPEGHFAGPDPWPGEMLTGAATR